MRAARSLDELAGLDIAPRVVRAASVEAQVSTPTVTRVLRGLPTKRSTRDRVALALVALGLVEAGVDLTPPVPASSQPAPLNPDGAESPATAA
jgi:hypothetical protein